MLLLSDNRQGRRLQELCQPWISFWDNRSTSGVTDIWATKREAGWSCADPVFKWNDRSTESHRTYSL